MAALATSFGACLRRKGMAAPQDGGQEKPARKAGVAQEAGTSLALCRFLASAHRRTGRWRAAAFLSWWLSSPGAAPTDGRALLTLLADGRREQQGTRGEGKQSEEDVTMTG